MSDDSRRPSISIIFHDKRLDRVAVARAVRKALDRCFPCGRVSLGSARNDNEEATMSFLVRPDEADGREHADPAGAAIGRIAAHCDLLDELGIANGTKAIAIALHAEWTDFHRARFGEAANPATVKRWRTMRRRGVAAVAAGSAAWTRRPSAPARVVRGLRRHHAIRVSAVGGSVRDGYERAMAELRAVNEDGHRFYGRSDGPLPSFSYETFRRDCLSIRRGRPAW
jgi:hypothetical protein